MKKSANVSIRLDLTKDRFNLIKDVQNEANKNILMEYAFADINCRPVVKMKNGDYLNFNTLEEFYGISAE